ncbi:HpcH/HpaI aldolase/citrate lyase family protein [Roseicella frigidaeris]|uniref:CoA ester lyase n=1 Tax=Roseicella frigidaeris TaxID=2230885 RepID=A0A327M1W9_9PROT|nr:aldolase/citrate lyase family protein [Roseicella frigidaeris]RAI56162.1 CoA ester lyase [Roseicella frigidaeris]
MAGARRPLALCRSWLFLPGAEAAALRAAPALGADVLIQELEDFCPPDRRPAARGLCRDLFAAWRAAGALAAVRINPLEDGGREDLAAAMAGQPDLVLMSKVAAPEQVAALAAALAALEAAPIRTAPIRTTIVPNIESAAGVVRTLAIATASPRVGACLLAAEDLAADLDAERTPEGTELAHARSRFLLECTAAGVVAIDCPFTFGDLAAAEADLRRARALGFKAKSIVNGDQVALVNRLLTPSAAEVAKAGRMVAAFEAARARGEDRAEVDGLFVEVPTYLAAQRLLRRAAALRAAPSPDSSAPRGRARP